MVVNKNEIAHLIKSHRDDIARFGLSSLGLFGSFVRDEATQDSDVDLIVEFSPGRKNNPTWDLVDAIKKDSTLLTDSELVKQTTFESMDQLVETVDSKYYLRESYKEAIRLRYEKIKMYIGENPGDKDLDLAIKEIMNKEGRKRDFFFKAQ